MLSAFLKKLIFARQFCIVDGRIDILGIRQTMFPSELMIELQEIDGKKAYNITKKGIHGIMEKYAKKIGTTNEGMIKTIKDIFETFGLGKLELIDFVPHEKKARVRILNSPMCTNCGKNNNCALLPGALAGTFTFIFKKDINPKKQQKKQSSKGHCEFIIK